MHFFDDETIDWVRPDYERFHKAFKKDGTRQAFDATPIYLFWPSAIERLQAYNPEAKLIFLFRNPIERAFSHWCMEWARKRETLPFDQAIREGRQRVRTSEKALRTFSYVERGFYGKQVRQLLTHCPRSRNSIPALRRASPASVEYVTRGRGLSRNQTVRGHAAEESPATPNR